MPYLSYLYKKGFIFSTFFLYFFLYNQNFLLSNKQQLLFFIVWCTKKMKNIFLLCFTLLLSTKIKCVYLQTSVDSAYIIKHSYI